MWRRGGTGLRLLLWLWLCALGPGPAAACSPRCRHGGLCLADGSCLCSKGYEGERCQHGNGGGMRRGAAESRQGWAQALPSLSLMPALRGVIPPGRAEQLGFGSGVGGGC